jgi:hypothetical protein
MRKRKGLTSPAVDESLQMLSKHLLSLVLPPLLLSSLPLGSVELGKVACVQELLEQQNRTIITTSSSTYPCNNLGVPNVGV